MTPAAQRFWEQVAAAYQTSPLDIFIVVFSVVLLVGGLTTYAILLSRKRQRGQRALSQHVFDQKIAERHVGPSGVELLNHMSHYLRDRAQIHQLVTDEVAFNSCAAQMRENGEATAASIAALRVTLGFESDRSERAPRSSVNVPEGSIVLIARNKYRKPFKAKVLSPRPEAFRVRVVDQAARLPAGAGVDVFFHNNAGVFTFRSTVLGERSGEAMLTHSEEIKQYQKRKYYRKRVSLSVHVYPFDTEAPLLATFREIGGGGASLSNPDQHFKAGDNIELRFAPDAEEIRVTGTVVRVSDAGRTIHVNYEHIRDALRDRIYHAIFKPPKDEQEEMDRRRAQGENTTE